MTPSAHIACSIEALEEFSAQSLPWSRFFPMFFRQRRYAGSKDRRAVFTIVMDIFRHYFLLQRATIAIELEPNWRRLMLVYLSIIKQLDIADIEQLFLGKFATAALDHTEIEALGLYTGFKDIDLGLELPDMLLHSLEQSYGAELSPMMEYLCKNKASFDLRINPSKADREDVFEQLTEDHFPTTHIPDFPPHGLRLWDNANIQNHPLYQDGSIEIQDFGSQALCATISHMVKNHKTLWDFCAGAGGKSLYLAAEHPQLEVYLSDVTQIKLEEAKKRFIRAGLKQPTTLLTNQQEMLTQAPICESVIVDVPCSGMGTWRRNPDLKIRLTPQRLAEICHTQQQILTQASSFVASGGVLIYITCSLLYEENEAQIKKFLENHSEFAIKKEHIPSAHVQKSAEGYIKILPHIHQSDGFFMAILQKQ